MPLFVGGDAAVDDTASPPGECGRRQVHGQLGARLVASPERVEQVLGPSRGLGDDRPLVEREQAAVADDQAAADDDRLDVGGQGGVHQRRDRAVERLVVGAPQVHEHQVGQPTRLDGPRVQVRGAGAVAGRHLQHPARWEQRGISTRDLLQERRRLHHGEHVLVVVGRRAVGPQRDVDPGPQEPGHVRHPVGQVHVRDRAVHGVAPALGQDAGVLLCDRDAVGALEPLVHETEPVEVPDLARPEAGDGVGRALRVLGDVHVKARAVPGRNSVGLAKPVGGGVAGTRGTDTEAHPPVVRAVELREDPLGVGLHGLPLGQELRARIVSVEGLHVQTPEAGLADGARRPATRVEVVGERLEVHDRRDTTPDVLHAAQEREPVGILGGEVHVGRVRDPALPLADRQPVTQATKRGLEEVGVGVHEAGHHVAAGRVQHVVRRPVRGDQGLGRPDPGDPIAHDGDRLVDDPPVTIERDQPAATDQEAHGVSSRVIRRSSAGGG